MNGSSGSFSALRDLQEKTQSDHLKVNTRQEYLFYVFRIVLIFG
jgi:hypothetical protein